MAETRSSLERWVFLILGLAVAAAAAAYIWKTAQTPAQPTEPALGQHGLVPSFALTNQLGELSTRQDLHGRIWIANIIFSRCAGPCPRLSAVLQSLNQSLADQPDLRLVSLTADPGFDTPPVLAKYGQRYSADPGRWWFLTGPKSALYPLAMDGLKLAVMEKAPSEREDLNDLFIHSTVITLVDKRGQLRGFFEGLEPETPARVIEAVRRLAAEE